MIGHRVICIRTNIFIIIDWLVINKEIGFISELLLLLILRNGWMKRRYSDWDIFSHFYMRLLLLFDFFHEHI